MKKLKVWVALLCFMWIFPGLGQAATDIKIVLDGSQLSLPSGVKAENINSKVMIPIRVVSEKLGYSVGWEQKTKTVTIKQDQTVIKMVAGKKSATSMVLPSILTLRQSSKMVQHLYPSASSARPWDYR